MGFFRRHKLSDFTADECRDLCRKLAIKVMHSAASVRQCELLMEEWATYRELLARHEGENGERLRTD